MAKTLLLSIVVGMIAVPVLTARDRSPQRGLKRALILMALFNVAYILAVRYIYPHLL